MLICKLQILIVGKEDYMLFYPNVTRKNLCNRLWVSIKRYPFSDKGHHLKVPWVHYRCHVPKQSQRLYFAGYKIDFGTLIMPRSTRNIHQRNTKST